MEISIIVPVYNVAGYLPGCLESICRQCTAQMELLLIDDGSTDESGKICDRYQAAYAFVRVIHQPNRGVSAARNAGIRAAVGRYLLFIDADDQIADGACRVFLDTLQKSPADLYFLKAEKQYPGGKKIPLADIKMLSKACADQTKVFQYFSRYGFAGGCWDKLVKRDLICVHGIYFEEGVRSEDLAWSLRCILAAGSYRCIGVDYYTYLQMRTGSATSVFTLQGAAQLYHAIVQGIRLAGQADGRIRNYIYGMMAYEAEILLLYYGKLCRKDRRKLKDKVQSVCWLLKYRDHKRAGVIRLMVRSLGMEAASLLLANIYGWREAVYCMGRYHYAVWYL